MQSFAQFEAMKRPTKLTISVCSIVLDEHGGLYTFGSGASGALGHGDTLGQEFPVKIMEFGENKLDLGSYY
jgi:hypothetical protein